MAIPTGLPDSQSSSRLREAAEEARSRGCTYFVQTRCNGTLSYHSDPEAANHAARKYGKESRGLCSAKAFAVPDDPDDTPERLQK